MPRKQLSPPDENRRRAVRLTDGEAPSKQRFEDLSYPSELDIEIDEGAQAQSLTKKGKMSAEGYASYLLSIKTYTESGLREKMRNRGYGCDETDDAVGKMKRLGFLNDLRAAENAACSAIFSRYITISTPPRVRAREKVRLIFPLPTT